MIEILVGGIIMLTMWFAPTIKDHYYANLYKDEGLKVGYHEKGIIIYLVNLPFDSGDDSINAKGLEIIQRVIDVTLSTDLKSKYMYVEGHTDSSGDTDYNMKLGLNRAQAVADYLVARGLEYELIAVNSYGESLPVSAIDSENRRVEIVIYTR